jgi:hypothetical protein
MNYYIIYIFSVLLSTCSFREEYSFKNWSILTVFASPQKLQGAGNLKFMIYDPFFPNMHHTKFEKN